MLQILSTIDHKCRRYPNYVMETVSWQKCDNFHLWSPPSCQGEEHQTLQHHTNVRHSISTKYSMTIEEVRVIIVPPTCLDHTSNLAITGHRIFCRKCPHRGKLFIALLLTKLKQPHLAELYNVRMHICTVNFVRIAQGICPLWPIALVTFVIFKV